MRGFAAAASGGIFSSCKSVTRVEYIPTPISATAQMSAIAAKIRACRLSIGRLGERVADTEDRAYAIRKSTGGLDFLAQVPYVNVDGTFHAVVVEAQRAFDEFGSRKDAFRGSREHFENSTFGRC